MDAGAVARPDPSRRRRRPSAVVLVAVVALLVTGCAAGPVDITAPELDSTERAACTALVDSLPARLLDLDRREPDVPFGAAWGDPPVVLRCGVGEPAGFDELATCQVVNDVAWYVPEEQITGEPVDVLMTTVGREPNVEVSLPAEYFPPAAAMAQLSGPLLEHSTEVEPCG